MITIYHAPGTRSIRPIWLSFELSLDIEIETVPFTPDFLDSPEWRAISPAGKLPVLQDGDLTMFESGAMVEYILDRYGEGRLRPAAGSTESALHQQWSWFSESTLARPLGMSRMLRPAESEGSLADDARHKIESCLNVVDMALRGKQYLLGNEFYAADIMMGYSLVLTKRFKILDERFPATLAYVDRLMAREACKRAMRP